VYFYGVLGLVLALLPAGLVTTRSASVAWLSSRPMTFLAAISYTCYLIHGFFVNGVETVVPEHWDRLGSVVSAALSLGLAVYASWTVHRACEEPLRRYGVRLSRRMDERRAARREAPAALESVPA
jgi:peptidoglycan/LPS O-acetylase OafA/YrhL